MRTFLVILVSMLAGCAAPSLDNAQHDSLGLAGRTAGPAERCVLIQPTLALRASQADPHTLLYGSGRIIWANHLQAGCTFHNGDPLITQPIGSSYCRGDLVRSFDNFTHIQGPSCLLGDFIPYRS